MKILAYDTSGDLLTAALSENGKLLCELENTTAEKHGAALVPLLEKILKKARWKAADIDVLAVGVGPGSFTGLRVGVMTAKTLGKVWKKKIVAVPSLEAIAQGYEDGRVAVAVDARRGKVYAAFYEKKEGRLAQKIAPVLTVAEDFFKKTGVSSPVLDKPVVRASRVAEAAFERARLKNFITPEKLEPLYLHPKDCNVTLPKK